MPLTGNLYEILGLPRYASIDEVKGAFRRLAVQYHPDKNPEDSVAEEHFKQIAAAYSVLGDEEKKRNYDLRLSGMYTYVKQESAEEKRHKRQEQVAEMRRQMQEKDNEEIKEVYRRAQNAMDYKWRMPLIVVAMAGCLCVILSNWFLFDYLQEKSFAFLNIFFAYILATTVWVFFLSSLFKRWNAESIDRSFGFDIRKRIITFFLLYVFFMISFSFEAPNYYRTAHFNFFGKKTTGYLTRSGKNVILEYEVEGKKYFKSFEDKTLFFPIYSMSIPVIIEYSSLSPYINEVKEISYSEEI